jgi:transcriptional regulator with XRE-family HTH domain
MGSIEERVVTQGRSPSQLRSMFGANLRTLAEDYDSISALSRRLGINRTQFNRYLSGESFPRPDVLARICSFFDVDARILLEPVAEIRQAADPVLNPFLAAFVGAGAQNLPEQAFPSGFYRFSRRSFVDPALFVTGVVLVRRIGVNTMVRGFEAVEAMRAQDLPATPDAREFRGIVMQQDEGVALLVARRNAITASFNYLARTASFQNSHWAGYATRTVPEGSGLRATRLVYEHLGRGTSAALPAARAAGYCKEADLPVFHRRLLRTDQSFA